jgi:hypothetical protein
MGIYGYITRCTNQVLEPCYPLDAKPKLKQAEQGCTDASWLAVQSSDRDACSSQDFLPRTSDAVAERYNKK